MEQAMRKQTQTSWLRPPAPSRRGYTLIELVTVGAIAATLLSLSATAYFHWTRATTAETSLRILEANLVRARSYALSRLCAARVVIEESGRGDLVVVERRDPDHEREWIPVFQTNRLDAAAVAFADVSADSDGRRYLYFRTDGSCYLDEDGEDADASDEPIDIELTSRTAPDDAPGRIRVLRLDPRTGFASPLERSYADGR